MDNQEEFIASLKALLVRYNLKVVVENTYCYVQDSYGVVHCLDEFFYELIDME